MQLGDSLIWVNRTGYQEHQLLSYDIYNWKYNGALHYKLKEDETVILYYNMGVGSTPYTADNRVNLRNLLIQQFKAEYRSDWLVSRFYVSNQNSGGLI